MASCRQNTIWQVAGNNLMLFIGIGKLQAMALCCSQATGMACNKMPGYANQCFGIGLYIISKIITLIRVDFIIKYEINME